METITCNSWLFAVLTFLLGVIVKYLFNVFSSPKLKVDKYVVLDKDAKPWIRVKNQSICVKAYDLRFFIVYYQNGKRIHTKIIKEGVLRGKVDETYPITPQDKDGNDISYDITDSKNYAEITLIYRNKYNTMSVKEQRVIYKCQ